MVSNNQNGHSNRPNFVIILADDLGYGDLSCYGNGVVETPNINKMAAEGTKFTDFHVSAAVCTPSRASLLTGRFPQRAGLPGVLFADPSRGNYDHGLNQHEVTFSRLLQESGYKTGIVGKWHLGHHEQFNPLNHGFDYFRGYVHGNVDYISHRDGMGRADWWDGKQLVEEEGYTTHLITKHALKFMAEHREEPFCLYIAHEAVHSPFQGPDDEPVRGPEGKISSGRSDRRQAYKEMTEIMDDSVGAVLAALKGLGIAENTFVLFYSDNGAVTRVGSNAPLRGGKSSLWEGGHRIPAIAWWPEKVAAGVVSDEFITSCDIMPTLLNLAGVSLPEGHLIDGQDVGPVVFEQKAQGEREWFWQHHSSLAMRQGDWMLVNDATVGVCLFNLAEDLQQQNDLAEKHPQRVQAMWSAIERWQEDVEATATQQPNQASA